MSTCCVYLVVICETDLHEQDYPERLGQICFTGGCIGDMNGYLGPEGSGVSDVPGIGIDFRGILS